MRLAILTRLMSGDSGTFGLLQSEGFSVIISELPWRLNLPQISCIPAGSYICKWHKSPKFKWCYKVMDVPRRSEILIHSGNFVGDTSKGYKTNSYGCLLPALKIGKLGGQRAGLLSKVATTQLYNFFQQQDFQLEIKNAYDTSIPS